MSGSYVTVTTEGGRPAEALAKLLQQRAKFLDETAEQSVTAVMLDVLVSLRALTTVAKPNKKEVSVQLSPLSLSYTGTKNGKPRPCLRQGKARYTLGRDERLGYATKDLHHVNVYRWDDEQRKRVWYVVAHSPKEAQDWAFERVKRRAQLYKGLARIALSKLMMMSGSRTSQQMSNADAANKAAQLTRVVKQASGSNYSIQASDMLDYAKLALKGGDAAVNTALMRASNKIAATINHKCKDLLLFRKIETPFPEVARGKRP